MTHDPGAEARIRAAIAQLLAGTIPEGVKCDIKSLCVLAGVPRATLYRTYPDLKAEFERQRAAALDAGQQPAPRAEQIERLKAETVQLRERLRNKDAELHTLTRFRDQALSRLAAQYEEIVTLREVTHNIRPGEPAVVPLRRT